MIAKGERGTGLLEAVVTVAIVAIALGALLNAAFAAVHRFGADPVQVALQRACRRELRVAADLLKYQGSSIPDASIATTVPLASASPLPAQLTISTVPSGSGLRVTISAAATQLSQRATLTATLANRAPLPGSVLTVPGTVGQPTGAP